MFGRYEYQIRDNLNDLRIACRCEENPKALKPEEAYAPIIVQKNAYDPWGLGIETEINPNAITGNPTHRFQFLNREDFKDLGYTDLNKRFYDPSRGRFDSVDPITDEQEDQSTYQYSWNNPVNKSDPNGEFPVTIIVGALLKGGIELGGQLLANGGDFKKVDWADVAVEAGKGAIAGSGAGLFAIGAAEMGGALLKGSTDLTIDKDSRKSVFNGTKKPGEALFDAATDYAAGKVGDFAAGKIGSITKKALKESVNAESNAVKKFVQASNKFNKVTDGGKNLSGDKSTQALKTLDKAKSVVDVTRTNAVKSRMVNTAVKSPVGNVVNEGVQNSAQEKVKGYTNY